MHDKPKRDKDGTVEIFKNRQKNLRHLISKVNHLDGNGEQKSESENSDSNSEEVKMENEITEEAGEAGDGCEDDN